METSELLRDKTSYKQRFFNSWFKKTIGTPLYKYQEDLLFNHSKYNVVNKSRQTGISTFMAAYGLYYALLGKNVLIVSPSDRQSKHVMDIVNKFFVAIKPMFASLNAPIELLEEMKTSLRFKHGGEIRSMPNSANTVRGFTADIIILDEFAHFLNNTDEEIITAIAPSLSRGGEIWYISTPFGERGLYYKATVDSKQQFKLFIINWRDCPDLKEEVIRRLCPDPIAFSQEYENKFLGNIETEFPFDLLMKNVNSSLTYEEPLLSVNVWLGIDVGRKIDQTAILGCVKDGDKYKVVYKDVMSGIEYETQQRVIEMLMNTNQIVNVNIDETGIGNMLAENLSKRNSHLVRRYTFTAELKENLVINFKRLLIHNLVEMPDDAQLIQALHSIKRTFSSGGHLKFDADRTDLTGHADVAWAIMLACYDDNKSSDELVFYGLK